MALILDTTDIGQFASIISTFIEKKDTEIEQSDKAADRQPTTSARR